MPANRNKELDKAETRRLILDRDRPPYTDGANWLGHGSRGGKDAVIDYLLLDGATMERLLQERGSEASVRSHFQSLKTLHDLPVTRGPDDRYRFDRIHLGIHDLPFDRPLPTDDKEVGLDPSGANVTTTIKPAGATGSRYVRLSEFLANSPADQVRLSFQEIEQILGFALPDSAREHLAWWANSRTKDTHTWAHLWIEAGWEKEELSLAEQWVVFRRVSAGASRTQTFGPGPIELQAEDADPGSSDTIESFQLQDGDRRPLVERQIRERRGQSQFRNDLRARYGNRCLVTGCKILAVLEAAHISPYRGEGDNHPGNGLLLRADIHTLFDLDLLGIEPEGLQVRLHPIVIPEYGQFEGVSLCCRGDSRPSSKALATRFDVFRRRLQQPI